MPTIKFSHIYRKLLDSHNDVIPEATLLEVINVQLENFSQCFLEYDTDNVYKLPKKGLYLMLIFEKPKESYVTDRNIFTTLRRYTHKKENYYKNNIGKTFQVVVEKEGAVDLSDVNLFK